jgi:hypothetical protein
MVTVILFIHISLAVVSLSCAVGVITASLKQKIENALTWTKTMWYGTVATSVSGILLTIVSGSSIGRLCSTLFLFLTVILIAHTYQRSVRYQLANK